jgi:hypothetical protein
MPQVDYDDEYSPKDQSANIIGQSPAAVDLVIRSLLEKGEDADVQALQGKVDPGQVVDYYRNFPVPQPGGDVHPPAPSNPRKNFGRPYPYDQG